MSLPVPLFPGVFDVDIDRGGYFLKLYVKLGPLCASEAPGLSAEQSAELKLNVSSQVQEVLCFLSWDVWGGQPHAC